MTVMLIIFGVTLVLFIWGKLPPDVVALLAMVSLFLFGILDLSETFSGFSNPTVVMIAALFIIGEGLAKTGWTALAGKWFVEKARRNVSRLLTITTLGAGVLSGFVSNTGTVATLLPVTINAAWNSGSFPSKLLMPVAFGSNTGGLLTLTGTPPNIIVSNALIEEGLGSFSFFEFGLIGLPLLLLAILYFRYWGIHLLPENRTNNRPINIDSEVNKWLEAYQFNNDYYKLRIRSMSQLIDTRIGDWDFEKEFNVSIIRLKRRHPKILEGIPPFIEFPDDNTELRYHDVITVKGDSAEINRLMIRFKLGLLPLEPVRNEFKYNLINQEVGMAEVIITPKSLFVGQKIKLGRYFERFQLQLMGASRNGQPINENEIMVKAGDAFLLRGTWEDIGALKELYQNIVICGSPEGMAKDVDTLTYKSWISLATLILMIVLFVFNVVPGAMASLICAGIMVLSGVIPVNKVYKSISWTSVIMIAAMIPMGIAMQKTGVAQIAANSLVNSLGAIHPIMLLGGIFLLTTALSQTINNSATAVLMAPIALLAATSVGISPKPLMITVAISASTAFLTPVGTTTNAMVMTAGAYKFKDFLKVGAPLLLIFFIATLILVPLIWPF